MRIGNEDIILAAKTLRARQERGLAMPHNPVAAKRGKTMWIAAAACAAGIMLGFGIRALTTPSDTGANKAMLAQIDSLRQEVLMAKSVKPEVIREVVFDTIVQTKVITREVVREVPVMAMSENAEDKKLNDNIINEQSETESVGCSMMCDNIFYGLIALKN